MEYGYAVRIDVELTLAVFPVALNTEAESTGRGERLLRRVIGVWAIWVLARAVA